MEGDNANQGHGPAGPVDLLEAIEAEYPLLRLPHMNMSERRHFPKVRDPGPAYPAWVNGMAHLSQATPAQAVWVGGESDSGVLVGRVAVDGVLMPAHVDPRTKCAFVGWKGDVQIVLVFELLLLLRGRAEWVEASNGDVPPYAFPVGIAADGEEAFTARVARPDGSWRAGRLLPSEGACRVAEDAEEVEFLHYEVLCVVPSR